MYGFFFYITWDHELDQLNAAFLLDMEDELLPYNIFIGPWSLTEAAKRVLEDTKKYTMGQMTFHPKTTERSVKILSPLLSLVLYLCSENSDISDPNGDKPLFPKPIKTKKGPKMIPVNSARIWDVGVRMGSALRKARSVMTTDTFNKSNTKRPHIRRAHYHHFLVGPKLSQSEKERRFVLKWLPPIPVNVEDLEALPVVIRPVASKGERP
jgi:hypothetical protein